ncbi:MAG: hypothetical protein ABI645_01725 [Pseudomonadota bacterium]
MAAQPAAVREDFVPRLTAFETSFVHTVLEHRGIFAEPSLAEFGHALEVLRRYDEQCIANPGYDQGRAPVLDADDMASLRAKAYLLFGVIRPTPAQWHKAHSTLFGPLLCETCG